MINSVLLKYWSKAVDVDAQFEALGPDRLRSAGEFLRRLTELGHEDEIREVLSSEVHRDDPEAQGAARRRIDDLSLLLIVNARECTEQSRNQGRVNTAWLRLVSEFGSRTTLFRAHAAFLDGFLHDGEDRSADARQAFEEARDAYGYGDSAGSAEAALACSCALASLDADLGDFAAAEKAITEALEQLGQAGTRNTGWKDYLRDALANDRDRRDTLESLMSATTPTELRDRVASRPAARERRMVELLGVRAVRAVAQGAHDEAIRLATIGDWLAASQGTSADLRRRMGDFAASRGYYATSERLLAMLHAEAPDDLVLVKKLAGARLFQGRYKEAEHILAPAVAKSSDDPVILVMLANALLHLGELDKARVCAAAAVRLDPSEEMAKKILTLTGDETRSGRGVVLNRATNQLFISEDVLADPERAAELISAALIRANPAEAQSLLEAIARDKGSEAARRIAAMALGPAAPHVGDDDHLAQAESLFARKRLPEALAEYTLAIREDPDRADAYLGAGDCYYFTGKPYLAAAFFEESAAISPRAPTLFFLGNAYARCERLSQARRAYERALEIDPSYAYAQERLAEVQKQISEGGPA